MVPEYRYRLKSETLTVDRSDDGLQSVAIPAGQEITTAEQIEGRRLGSFDRNLMVAIHWKGHPLEMFLADLIERGERAVGAKG